jgi:hypothetical protein
VPYINLWGEQTLANTYVEHDPNVHRAAVYVQDADDGPNFFKQSPQRQRECMVRGLCQVCARPVPWSRRNLVISGVSVEFVTVEGQQRVVVFEPWLDDRCAQIAVKWCPALIRRSSADDLTVVPIRSQREAQLVVSDGWIEGDLERDAIHEWLRLHLVDPNLTPIDALIEFDGTFAEWRIEQYASRDGRKYIGPDGDVARIMLRRARKAPLPWRYADEVPPWLAEILDAAMAAEPEAEEVPSREKTAGG